MSRTFFSIKSKNVGANHNPSRPVPKLLNVCCTHGNEQVGCFIHDNYSTGKNHNFEWKSIIANPQAMSLNKRYIEQDLNRVFPGKADGNYEERLAYQISQILPSHDLVLDWHQSITNMSDTIFVKKLTPNLKEVCQYFDIAHIVELDKGQGGYQGTLISQVENGIALEYGNLHNHQDACRRVQRSLSGLLNKRRFRKFQNVYRMLDQSISLEFSKRLKLKDFQGLSRDAMEILGIYDLNIYPVFVGGYKEEGIYCKLVQKIKQVVYN